MSALQGPHQVSPEVDRDDLPLPIGGANRLAGHGVLELQVERLADRVAEASGRLDALGEVGEVLGHLLLERGVRQAVVDVPPALQEKFVEPLVPGGDLQQLPDESAAVLDVGVRRREVRLDVLGVVQPVPVDVGVVKGVQILEDRGGVAVLLFLGAGRRVKDRRRGEDQR